jgi:hypothetical protein
LLSVASIRLMIRTTPKSSKTLPKQKQNQLGRGQKFSLV